MGWLVQGNKESAEAAGADPEGDRVMFAITPNYITEVYNRYRNNVYGDELGCEDRWELLSDEQREKLLDAIKDYISQSTLIDEDLIDVMYGVEASAAAEALK